jgi:polysaccharide export outer membrane protein
MVSKLIQEVTRGVHMLNIFRLLLLSIIFMSGCANNVMPEKLNLLLDADRTYATIPQYYIGVEDTLQVNVWRNADLSVSVPVRPDGRISVPLIGDVIAGGKKPEQVAEEIKSKLSKYIREPQVTVILTQLSSHEFISRIRVTGAVQKPISVPYRQGMTVLDAVLEAGGVNEFAAPNRASLYRTNKENNVQQYDIQLGQILNSGELETNYKLIPNDIVTVPERFF